MKKLFAFLGLSILFLVLGLGVLFLINGDGLHSVLVNTTIAHEDKPHLLVFHAPWCGKCPTSEEIARLAAQFPNVDVSDIDIDKNPKAKEQYHASRVPLFILCTKAGCKTTRNYGEAKGWLREF